MSARPSAYVIFLTSTQAHFFIISFICSTEWSFVTSRVTYKFYKFLRSSTMNATIDLELLYTQNWFMIFIQKPL